MSYAYQTYIKAPIKIPTAMFMMAKVGMVSGFSQTVKLFQSNVGHGFNPIPP